MLELRDAAAAELDRGQRHDEIVAAKERRAAELLTQLRAAASAVSETRREAAGRLGPRVQRALPELGGGRARFDIAVAAGPAPQNQARGLHRCAVPLSSEPREGPRTLARVPPG